MTPSEEDLVREPLLRELSLWRAPCTFSSASNTTKDIGEGDSSAVSTPDAGVEETKGEEGVLAETKEDSGKGVRGSSGGKGTDGAQAKVGLVFDKKGGSIAARFEVLQQVNRKLRDALPYFDLTQVRFDFAFSRSLLVYFVLGSCACGEVRECYAN